MLGIAVRELREKAGINQADVAIKAGVSNVTISRYERGERQISLKTLMKIADAIGVTAEDIQERARELEAAAPKSSTAAPELIEYVHSQDSLVAWQRAVGRAKHADPMIKLLLLTLPILIDEDAWIVLTTVEQLIETTHMHEEAEKIHEVWPQVVESPWVERVGQVEWVFRLRFGDVEVGCARNN